MKSFTSASWVAVKGYYLAAARMLKNQSKHELYPYWRMVRTIEDYSEKQCEENPSKGEIVIKIPSATGNFTLDSYKQLFEIDKKYKDVRFKFQLEGQFQEPDKYKVRSHNLFKRILENQFHTHYAVGQGGISRDDNKDFVSNKFKVQIYFVATKYGLGYHDGVKGFEVRKPPTSSLPFIFNDDVYQLQVEALQITPYVKKIGISSANPDFDKLINSTVDLPLIGEVGFIETDLAPKDKLIGLTPSYNLEHRKLFEESEYEIAKVGQLSHSETGEVSKPDTVAHWVALNYGVSPPLTNVATPYIVDYNLIPKATEEIEPIRGDYDQSSVSKSHSNPMRFINQKADYKYDLEKVKQLHVENLIFKGKSLASKNSENTTLSKDSSADVLRGAIMDVNHLSDSQIIGEHYILNLWSHVLQHLYFEYDNYQFQYIASLKSHLEFHNEDVKPWDNYILGKFYEIKDKSTFSEFIHKLSQYIAITLNEPNQSESRKNLIQTLVTNITYRLLQSESMLYYPGISKYYINQFNYAKFDIYQETVKTLNLEETNLPKNSYQKYIKYDIETIEYDESYDLLFKTIKAVSELNNYTSFYSLKCMIKTDSPIIWENEELITKAANYIKNDNTGVKFLKFDDKIEDSDTKYSFAQKIEFDSTTSFYYYRDLELDYENLSDPFKRKLAKFDLKMDPIDSLFVNKKKLLYAFIRDVLVLANTRKFSPKEQVPMILYVVEIVSQIPPEFFRGKTISTRYEDLEFPIDPDEDIPGGWDEELNYSLPHDLVSEFIEKLGPEVIENTIIPKSRFQILEKIKILVDEANSRSIFGQQKLDDEAAKKKKKKNPPEPKKWRTQGNSKRKMGRSRDREPKRIRLDAPLRLQPESYEKKVLDKYKKENGEA